MAAKTRYRDNWLRAAVRDRQMDGWEIDRQIDRQQSNRSMFFEETNKEIMHGQLFIETDRLKDGWRGNR